VSIGFHLNATSVGLLLASGTTVLIRSGQQAQPQLSELAVLLHLGPAWQRVVSSLNDLEE